MLDQFVRRSLISASLFFILYYRASLWAPQAYKYHNEVRCGHDLYAFKDMLQKLDENHPSQLEVGSSFPNPKRSQIV